MASTWAGLVNGVCGVDKITAFDASNYATQIAAEVKNFDPTLTMSRKDARRFGKFIQYAYAAARQAVDDAALKLEDEDPTRIGLEASSALGGVIATEAQSVILHTKGAKKVNPTLIPSTLINMVPAYIGIQLNIQGPTNAPVSACATGLSAVGEAMRRIVWGDADVMIAGASDAPINPISVVGFSRLGALSTRNNAPHRAIIPFDAERVGTVLGEGAAMLVLESLEHAQARGAEILAEVVGYAMTADAHHITAPSADGRGAARVMKAALKDANLRPQDINLIMAHATGTPLNDAAETQAIKTAFGAAAYHIPVSAIKSMTGHMLGAAGALSIAAAVKAMQTNLIPPTIGLRNPDPACDLDYVPLRARQAEVRYAMANGFGFGGQNVSVILKGMKAEG
jgi:3-oxoacyl-[acyl-carrier-protein] synthase II